MIQSLNRKTAKYKTDVGISTIGVRSNYLDEMNRLASEQGKVKVQSIVGSGVLVLKGSVSEPEYQVAFEIDVLMDPRTRQGGAIGSIVGARQILRHAVDDGGAQLRITPDHTVDIQIRHMEEDQAYIVVLSPMPGY